MNGPWPTSGGLNEVPSDAWAVLPAVGLSSCRASRRIQQHIRTSTEAVNFRRWRANPRVPCTDQEADIRSLRTCV